MFVLRFCLRIRPPKCGEIDLINSFGPKVLIVSPKPQTTRDRIQAILTTEKSQIIFLDTPGMHKAKVAWQLYGQLCHEFFKRC